MPASDINSLSEKEFWTADPVCKLNCIHGGL